MNAKATTLFFILIALTSSSRTASENLAEGQSEEPKDVLTDMMVNLFNPEIDQSTAINQLTSTISSFLGVEVPQHHENPVVQLAAFLDHRNYDIKTFADLPEDATQEGEIKRILEAIPSSESLLASAGQDKSQAIQAALKEIKAAGESYIRAIRKLGLKEWFTGVQGVLEQLRDENGTVENPQVDVQDFGPHAKTFLQETLMNKLKNSGEVYKAALKAEEFKEIRMNWNLVLKGLYNTFYNHVDEMTHMLTTPLPFLANSALELLERTVATNDHLLVAQERMTLLTGALAVLSQEFNSHNYLKQVLQMLTEYAHSESTNTQEGESILLSPEIKEWVVLVFQGILNAMVGLPVDLGQVHEQVYSLLSQKTSLYLDEKSIKEVIVHSTHLREISKIDSAKPADLIRGLDLLLHLSTQELSPENFKVLYPLVHAIHSLDQPKVDAVQRLKILLNIPKLLPFEDNKRDLDNRLTKTAIYEMTLACVEYLPSERLSEDSIDLFDESMEALRTHFAGTWVEPHILTAKMFNLLFTLEDSTHLTTLPHFVESAADVREFKRILAANPRLAQELDQTLERISTEHNHPVTTPTALLSDYSGKSLEAKLFHRINRKRTEEQQIVGAIEVKPTNVKVNLYEKEIPANKITVDGHIPQRDNQDHSSTPSKHEKTLIENRPVTENPFSGLPEDLNDEEEIIPVPRIKKGTQYNLVNRVVGRIPPEILKKLEVMTFNEFVNGLSEVEVVDGVRYVNKVVRVVRRESPCHPARQGEFGSGNLVYC